MTDLDPHAAAQPETGETDSELTGFWKFVRIVAVVAVVLVVVMFAAVLLSEITATDSTDNFSVEDPVDAVRIETVGGRVVVEAAAVDAVEVVRTEHYSIVEPDGGVEIEGMTLTLTDGCSRSVLLIPNCSVDFLLRVPPDTSIAVDAERTDITITGVTGSLNLDTTAADIELADTGGAVTVQAEGSDITTTELRGPGATILTNDGSILLDFVERPDVVDAETTVGPVRIVVPQGAYAVEVDAANGDVDIGVIDDPSSQRRVSVTNSVGDVQIVPRP